MWLRERIVATSALMRRDLVVRFGRDNIGFAWVIVEPMILTVGVMTMWLLLKPPFEHGIAVVSLVLTGYMPITLFRHITNAHVNILKNSAGLFFHRPITAVDVVASRFLVELTGITIALLVIYGILLASNQIEPIEDVRLVVWAWLMMAYWALGIALCFAAVTELSEVAERFVTTFQYLLLPISGTFYLVTWLPSEAQSVIWYMPMVHCFEMFRDGFFGSRVVTYYSPAYTVAVSTLLLIVGGLGLSRAREHLSMG